MRVGEVEGVYTEGTSELAEYIAVKWDSLGGTPILLATRDVETIEPRGVILMGTQPEDYAIAPPFDPKTHPLLRRLG